MTLDLHADRLARYTSLPPRRVARTSCGPLASTCSSGATSLAPRPDHDAIAPLPRLQGYRPRPADPGRAPPRSVQSPSARSAVSRASVRAARASASRSSRPTLMTGVRSDTDAKSRLEQRARAVPARDRGPRSTAGSEPPSSAGIGQERSVRRIRPDDVDAERFAGLSTSCSPNHATGVRPKRPGQRDPPATPGIGEGAGAPGDKLRLGCGFRDVHRERQLLRPGPSRHRAEQRPAHRVWRVRRHPDANPSGRERTQRRPPAPAAPRGSRRHCSGCGTEYLLIGDARAALLRQCPDDRSRVAGVGDRRHP